MRIFAVGTKIYGGEGAWPTLGGGSPRPQRRTAPGLKWFVAFKHSSPDMAVQRVEVRRVRRPFIFTSEFTAVGSNQSWVTFAVSAGAPSCWKMKPDGKTNLQSWTSSGNRVSTLVLYGIKCNLSFPPKQSPAETMTWMKITSCCWLFRAESKMSHRIFI